MHRNIWWHQVFCAHRRLIQVSVHKFYNFIFQCHMSTHSHQIEHHFLESSNWRIPLTKFLSHCIEHWTQLLTSLYVAAAAHYTIQNNFTGYLFLIKLFIWAQMASVSLCKMSVLHFVAVNWHSEHVAHTMWIVKFNKNITVFEMHCNPNSAFDTDECTKTDERNALTGGEIFRAKCRK